MILLQIHSSLKMKNISLKVHHQKLKKKYYKSPIQKSIFIKKKKTNAAYYEENWAERKERKEYYQSFTKDKLLAMTEEEFLEYISKLWSMLIWGNKKYVVDKMIADNGFALKE